ncbi:MAG: 3-deoxy-7-phosphoheptulonate synthase, partial [Christensenellaceae bacterium]|nr:3-deoxy-7-phosphoheptulonate synthase [Christensenellaceae bacterium]
MVVILKSNPDEKQLSQLTSWLEGMEIRIQKTVGVQQTILGLIGDTTKVDIDLIRALDIVADVRRIAEPYKSANRKFHPDDTVVSVNGVTIGGGNFRLIAGPCSVESEEQIIYVAKRVKAAGATMLRGGAFKPRTSPYAFQGLQADGIRLLLEAKKETGLPVVSEIMNASHLDLFEGVDV